MNRVFSILFLLAIMLTTACASSSGTGSARTAETTRSGGKDKGNEKVVEDLSLYRPKYTVPDAAAPAARMEPVNHVNDRVEVLMDTVASVNKGIRFAQGYRILAYNGSERQTVMNLRKAIISRVPEEKDYLTYQQPNFRLKIGDFFSRIEAQQVLNKIQDLIPNAQIVSEQININKSY
ncbi:sporulation protein [Pontibacter silvestris]|uniref:Sporulation protein n=1 Tax=Pontibacter silvestris TaxID=2305183 RepID=A0ABW4WTK5_9BACT|nr:sporulation protein [Pontibacter silvestris]MCC9137190.1 sporulation protein [Pontibacter silvestris]